MKLYRSMNYVKVISNSLSAGSRRSTSFINEENDIFGNMLLSIFVIIRSLIRGFLLQNTEIYVSVVFRQILYYHSKS